ncbi:hypothetical protein Vretimale_19746 [Volvox reticuliferus]|uniref:NADH dehydrogenase [ubiquinone] 1 alpha subcomplex subunit 12 n=1 Tax=Volvox reticuliferus TaxID=1737510 RepID=A0A8J4M004_9CHLO|nr:hypothetical protein Vretifemale_20743 [Volvox reticuliferus]GIM17244.1 hypothetical protein Vretimale_19746 [Volvox reticuliferus]
MTGRPHQHSALRRAFGAAFDWAIGKKAVGKDAAGNVYYRWFEGSGADRVERREVQWVTAYMYYDPKDIPSAWRMWLRKQRDDPPTDEEIQQNAVKEAALKSRVAALEETERLRRLRQQAVGTPDQHAGAQPDMARFLQQMAVDKTGGAEAGAAEQQGRVDADDSIASPSPSPTPSSNFKPETWRPGS